MKHKISKLLLIPAIFAILPACVEVKDQDEEPKAMVQVIEGGELTINEPMYLIEGKFLRESELQNTEKSQTPPKEYAYSFSKLEIGPHGKLYTMGNVLRIHAQNFSAWGGMIASFPEGHVSTTGDGRSGGHLMLWANQVEGSLKVVMRGETGKQGETGNAPDESLKGFPGAPGQSAQYTGSDEGGPTYSNPEPGGTGHQGKKGFTGKQGYKGGNSGTFEFTSVQDSKIYLLVEMFAGAGGIGGFGGQGGAGGDGGLGGKSMSLKPRSKEYARVKSGDVGPQGPTGDPGEKGTSGLIETACVTIAGIMECKSESFDYSR